MAYCPPKLLDDLAGLFADLRTWAGVLEKRPGIFYARNQPFLHFHILAGGRRRADVKGRTDWVQLDLPRPITCKTQRNLDDMGREQARALGADRARSCW